MPNRWGLKRKQRSIPAPTKFDRLSDDDLFVAVEHGLANAITEFAKWQRKDGDPEQRAAYLALTETHMQTALGALHSMMRHHELRVS
jgi:hypothetical protein